MNVENRAGRSASRNVNEPNAIQRSATIYAAGEILGLNREQTENILAQMQQGNKSVGRSRRGGVGLGIGGGLSRTQAEDELTKAAASIQDMAADPLKYEDLTDEEFAQGQSEEEYRKFMGMPEEGVYAPEDEYRGQRVVRRKNGMPGRVIGSIVDLVRPEEGAFANNDALRTVSPASFNTQVGQLKATVRNLEAAKAQAAAEIAGMSPVDRIMASVRGRMPKAGQDLSNIGIYINRLADEAGIRPMTAADQQAVQAGIAQGYRYDPALGGGNAAYMPVNSLFTGDRGEAAYTAQLNTEMQDSELNAAARYRNEVRAYNEAQDIARDQFTVGRVGAQGDLNIRDLGGISSTVSDFMGIPYQSAESMPIAGINNAGVAVDPTTGTPLGRIGPESPLITSPNTPYTDNILNAPKDPQTQLGHEARKWTFQQYMNSRPEGVNPISSVERQFTDINEITKKASELMTATGVYGPNRLRQLRDPNDLQKFAVKMLTRAAEIERTQNKKTIVRHDPKTNKNSLIRASEATIADVLTTIKMSPSDQVRLSNALAVIAQAPDSERKAAYMSGTGPIYNPSTDKDGETIVNFNEMKFGPGEMVANVAEAQNERAPLGDRRIPGSADWYTKGNLAPRLRGLGVGPAFIGVALDESGKKEANFGPNAVNRFNSTGVTGEAIPFALRKLAEERARRDRKPVNEELFRKNAVKAMLVDARESRDNKARADRMSAIIAAMPPGLRSERIDDSAVFVPGQPFYQSTARPGRFGFQYR